MQAAASAVGMVLGGFIATRPLRYQQHLHLGQSFGVTREIHPRGAKPQNVAVADAFMVKGLSRRRAENEVIHQDRLYFDPQICLPFAITDRFDVTGRPVERVSHSPVEPAWPSC